QGSRTGRCGWITSFLRTKSGSAAVGSRSQMFFTRRGACTPRGEAYLAEESQALELDITKSGGR
ncbi:hypothetical protein CYL15_00315, partial [Geobacillus thermodenitrificans]|nr:hypothetical protein [Geobacillus thermodenitrificans]